MTKWTKALALVMITLCCLTLRTVLAQEAVEDKTTPPEEKATSNKQLTDEELKQVSKDILAANKDAIVVVRIVLKIEITYGGRSQPEREETLETNGTVVDPSGLTIVPDAYANPPIPENPNVQVDFSVTDIKIVLNDGKELPASIVLRDEDLDLAFIRPDEKGLELPCIKLAPTPAPNVLEHIIGITRLDFSTGREPLVVDSSVLAIIKKPRVYYLGGFMELGNPAFNTEGQCLGISLTRKGSSAQGPGSRFLGSVATILPTEDIIEVMQQIPPPKEKDDEDDEETVAEEPEEALEYEEPDEDE
ncbi:serine protease [Planctomycetota bacterium]